MTAVHITTTLKNLHTELAQIVYPDGVILHCRQCQAEQTATPDDCATYLARGWPRHCNYTMRVIAQVESTDAQPDR